MLSDYPEAPSPNFSADMVSLKTLPHSLEAERSLLGGIMLSETAWDAVAELVTPSDFYYGKHGHIFTEMARLAEAAEPLDVITLAEALQKRALLEASGGLIYLADLAKSTPSAANIRAYANIVHDRATLRRIINTATSIQETAFNPEGRDAGDVLDSAERLIMQIAEQGPKSGGPVGVNALLKEALGKIDELFNSKGSITGLTTGYKDLDSKTSGLQASDLIIVAGRPSMGKTSFAMNLVENAILADSKPILVFSMEMPAGSLMMRLLSSVGKIDQTRVRNGQLEEEDWAKLSAAMQQLKDKPLLIDDTPALTPTEIRSRARKVLREQGSLGMIMIDYLQLMQVAGSSEGRTAEISEISRSLKSIAKEFNCPVIALSQLNRSLEQRPNKRPVMSDLRESGAIEQDADVIMFIYRDEVYNEESPDKGTAEIIIGKQRNGPIGTSRLAFVGQFTRFENLAHSDYSDDYE
ncbi:MAG: replicative DNA helicase [Cellvibrionales bacterium]|nr:replicative DNA helicase [Cellvibrionales bacterium]MBT5923850.1 replicative DNA helicase [Cellvibrionales bacterium]MBT6579843.1 replicative DNA helicase [Cellvibrionales bacterium]